ncbi:MAG: NADH-quinone oxidoreductase subunit I [Ignavibacteriae bacterium]|nr:NADH-quinone oxidoreductase subunit I [Ignavibacteriota bacterium]
MKQYFINTWDAIWTVLVGMQITLKHVFVPSVTIQYPIVKPELPDRARNRLFVNMNDCIGCMLCSRACPVNCIEIETVKAVPTDMPGITSNGKKKVLWVTQFNIDIGKCCFCSLCTFPCPTECIQMTDVYEYTEFEREDLVYKFATLSPEEINTKQEMFDVFQKEKEEAKIAAAKAKAEAKKKELEEKENAKPKTDDNPKNENE